MDISKQTIKVIFDMETSDPDDFITLIFLATHPRIELVAVTIFPGSKEQVSLVKWLFDYLKLSNIPIGSCDINWSKPNSVSAWHYKAFGKIPICKLNDIEEGWKVLSKNCGKDVTLFTGAPLKNLGKALKNDPNIVFKKWVCQGGFCGEGIVPPNLVMDKFKGLKTCPTFNLNGDVPSALAAIAYQGIPEKQFISKNVCHKVVYDDKFHEYVTDALENLKKIETSSKSEEILLERKILGLKLLIQGMEVYLGKNSDGKKLHDPLAASTILSDNVITMWEQVDLYREKGGWGSKRNPNSTSRISIDYDHNEFQRVICEF